MRSARLRRELPELVVVSLLFIVDEFVVVSVELAELPVPVVEPVPLAPMLDVPVPVPLAAVLPEPVVLDEELLLGEVLELLLGEVLLLEPEFMLEEGLLLVVPLVPVVGPPLAPVAALLPVPEPPVPEEEPEDCARATPPMARAAAAAKVVRVFFVLIMSNSLIADPQGDRLKKAGVLGQLLRSLRFHPRAIE